MLHGHEIFKTSQDNEYSVQSEQNARDVSEHVTFPSLFTVYTAEWPVTLLALVMIGSRNAFSGYSVYYSAISC